MTTITTREVLDAYAAVQALGDMKMNFQAAMAVRKLARELKAIQDDYVALQREIIERYAQRDENGEIVREENYIPLTDAQAYQREHGELMATQVEVSGQLSANLFGNLQVEPDVLIALGDLLVEETA